MKEADKTANNTPFFYKILLLGVAILAVWLVSNKIGKKVEPKQNIIESVAQLSPDPKYSGMGTANKTSIDNKDFQLNVTAFLGKPKGGQFYTVYLKGNGADLKDMYMGKMDLSGDVFSLNYATQSSIFGYKNVEVALETEAQITSGKMGTTVLSGAFDK